MVVDLQCRLTFPDGALGPAEAIEVPDTFSQMNNESRDDVVAALTL